MNEHLVFYDDECPVCHKGVQHVIEIDKNHHIKFAPLNGETAAKILTGPLAHYARANSLILIENYESTDRQFWIRSRALMRIYWLVGNGWGLFGWLSFLPGWFGDLFYKELARHRHQFKLKMTQHADASDRFLP